VSNYINQARSWAATANTELESWLESLPLIAKRGQTEEVGDQIGRLANLVSRTEGKRATYTRAANMLELGNSPERVAELLTRTVLGGADDQVADRHNDNRRAHHDGVLTATRQLLGLLGGE
jgi:hypothetical protein